MKLVTIILFFFSVALGSPYKAYSQNVSSKVDSIDWYNNRLKIDYIKTQISDYKYHMYANDHAIKVYNLHHSLSRYIFFLVVIIVLMGLIFSGVQFFITLKSIPKKIDYSGNLPIQGALTTKEKKKTDETDAKDQTPKEEESSKTTVKFGKDGIEISSSILGVIILAMSFAFFYMYIHFVYPVMEVTQDANIEVISSKK